MSVISFQRLLYFKFVIQCLVQIFLFFGSTFSLLLVSVIHLLTDLNVSFYFIFYYCIFAMIPCQFPVFYVPLNELGFPGPPTCKFPVGY